MEGLWEYGRWLWSFMEGDPRNRPRDREETSLQDENQTRQMGKVGREEAWKTTLNSLPIPRAINCYGLDLECP